MPIWSLNVKQTDALVVTVESPLSKSPHGKSRELRATSGSPFPDIYVKCAKFTCQFGALIVRFGPSRCRHTNLQVRELSVRVSRAPYALWDPISDMSAQKCERFLTFLEFGRRNLKFNYFVRPVIWTERILTAMKSSKYKR